MARVDGLRIRRVSSEEMVAREVGEERIMA